MLADMFAAACSHAFAGSNKAVGSASNCPPALPADSPCPACLLLPHHCCWLLALAWQASEVAPALQLHPAALLPSAATMQLGAGTGAGQQSSDTRLISKQRGSSSAPGVWRPTVLLAPV